MFALIQLVQMEWGKRRVNHLAVDAMNVTAMKMDIHMVNMRVHIFLVLRSIVWLFRLMNDLTINNAGLGAGPDPLRSSSGSSTGLPQSQTSSSVPSAGSTGYDGYGRPTINAPNVGGGGYNSQGNFCTESFCGTNVHTNQLLTLAYF